MRSTLRNVLPSMFHRRLLLLAGVMVAVIVVLGTATTMLATGQSHREARETAESLLQSRREIETKRGAILDRNGVVLAEEESGWEVAVHFDLLNGEWGAKQAYAAASRDKLAWSEMTQKQRDDRVASLQREYDQQAQALFNTLADVTGTPIEEIETRRTTILARIKRMQDYLWEQWQKKESQERGELVPLTEIAKPIAAELQHHVLIPSVSDDLYRQIQRFIDEGDRARDGDEQARSALPWTMVTLRRTRVRLYPMDRVAVTLDRSTLPGPLASDEPFDTEVAGLGLHLIGRMRDVWKEDVRDHPLIDHKGLYHLDGYRDGDRIGSAGIEATMEHELRGARGLRTINLDTGKPIAETAPLEGRDVVLSIDIMLQAEVQAIMKPDFGLMQVHPWNLNPGESETLVGLPRNGAAVVLDIASGDVLAAVSMPEAPRELLEEDSALLLGDKVNDPMLNRVLGKRYPTGSVVKPFVVAAAMADGVLGVDELVDTPGHLWEEHPTVFRDWIFKLIAQSFSDIEGGPISAVYAIARSSNVFMGLLAERLIAQRGLDRLPQWFEAFGFGVKPGIGLPEEVRGAVGPEVGPLEHNQVCFMSIGQGPIDSTPLQVAQAYARLVSGDMNRSARLVVAPQQPTHPPAKSDLPPIPERVRQIVLEGMRQGANEPIGTTYNINKPSAGITNVRIFDIPGVTVMAKSGTAAPGNAIWTDYNRDGQHDENEFDFNPRDFSWVVALVQPDGAPNPTHVVVCVVDHGGSGGRAAGPVVNQIIRAMQRHRYLDWPPIR